MCKRTTTALIGAALAVVLVAGIAAAADEDGVTGYVRFQKGDLVAYGLFEGEKVRRLEGDFGQWKPTGETYQLEDITLLVPSEPTKVLACALNYKSHAGEQDLPEVPQLFFKAPSCLIAQGENIVVPKEAERVDYEAEMVIVIRRRAKDVPEDRALDYVLGVTCGNDVSERVWQKGDVQWWRAKGSDTFGPCGPVVVGGIDYGNLWLTLRLNGEVRQRQNTRDLIFSVPEVVSFVSRHVTLEPGDLIYTGTPGKTSPIKPGDVVEVELEGVGVLRNPVE
jgi:2-keto-4-pentenoate hydratase/2-oxohepta-3-ene-1,7-dioic acid hydratase in catechol pathway